MSGRRVLVTGGAGFIGSHVCDQLLRRGHAPVVLDDLSMGTKDRVPAGVPLVVGSVADAPLVERTIVEHGCDAVCHLAARVSIRASTTGFVEDAQTNVMGTLGVLRAVLNTQVRRVVFTSSMAVYADADPAGGPLGENHATKPISPYGIGKLAGEMFAANILAQGGRDSVVLRLFNTYGPGQTFTPYVGVITIFITQLLKGQSPVIFGDGRQVRDFVYVRDVASAFVAAVEREGASGVYNIGSGRGRSVTEIAELLRRHVNPAVPVRHAPADPSELRYSVADISRAARDLGYAPHGDLETALAEIIENVRARSVA